MERSMRIIISVLLILISLPLFAGEKTGIYNFGIIESGGTYLFGDNVRIRKSPEIKEDNVKDTLPAGYAVTVDKKTDKVMSMNGFSSNWYVVSYKNKGKKDSGYVWGGLLSIGYVKSGSDLFLLGIKSFDDKKGFQGECRLVSGGQIASALTIELHDLPEGDTNPFYSYTVSLTLNNGMGLTGLSSVVDIYSQFGACGYPFGHNWIGIAGKKIYYLGKDNSVSEAGVFHYDERMVFPSQDKALKDEVRLVIESFDFDEKIKDYRLSDRKEKRFTWKDYKMEERK